MKTKRELVVEWKGWTLTIPAGTAVETNPGADRCARPAHIPPALSVKAEECEP